MFFQQKVNSWHENIDYFRLSFFQAASNNFNAQFYREFCIDGVKYNLKVDPALKSLR